MNIKQIRALAGLLDSYHLNVIEVSEGDVKIRLEKSSPKTQEAHFIPAAAASEAHTATAQTPVDFNKINEIKAPMVGVFYCASSPESEPFVKIGSRVKKGDTLCIIEAMKLMNEITAEMDGEIVDICTHNGDIVEFGQTLFKLY